MGDKPKNVSGIHGCVLEGFKMRDLRFGITERPLLLKVDPYVEMGWTLKVQHIYINLKPKVTSHCYNMYLFRIFVIGILNLFDSY